MSSGSMSRRRSLLGLLGGAAAIPFAAPSRSAPASNCGLVVLTVGGLVGSPNRPPFDEKRDRFFQHNNLDFKQARVFTFGDLLAFPQQSAPVVEESGEILFKGPRLHDVLAAAKPLSDAKTARLSALDGYGEQSLSPRSIRKVDSGCRSGRQCVRDWRFWPALRGASIGSGRKKVRRRRLQMGLFPLLHRADALTF